MPKSFLFQQIHIDAARNATDDFNPFHEPRKCAGIRGNPYAGPIVLGFQLECLIEHQLRLHRELHGEEDLIAKHKLHFSNYQLTFAGALLPDEPFEVDVRPTLMKTEPFALSNRVIIRKSSGIVMMGYKRETTTPLILAERNLDALPDLRKAEDRALLPGTSFFIKRKFMNTGNAKNFAVGSLCNQDYYFDELEDRVNFPEMFPASLLSCALLEKALNDRHDFMQNPVVYASHNISVDRRVAKGVRSNDALHILVEGPVVIKGEKGLGTAGATTLLFNCFGVVRRKQILYRAEVQMAPLDSIRALQKE